MSVVKLLLGSRVRLGEVCAWPALKFMGKEHQRIFSLLQDFLADPDLVRANLASQVDQSGLFSFSFLSVSFFSLFYRFSLISTRSIFMIQSWKRHPLFSAR